ncbi:MAG: hypothetical protein IJ033_00620 [Clostridia bacterium]|nr:hypothetical protein [Clostridia bacterium]
MERDEVLQKAQSKKAVVGEYENQKISKSNWISVIVTGIIALAFIIVFGALGQKAVCFAIGGICFSWATTFYFCQYFIAKRKHIGILLGAIGELLGAIIMILNFILSVVGVI